MEHTSRPHGRSLPPITSITSITDGYTPPSTHPTSDIMSPLPFRTAPAPDPRDSGHWSASKHSSGISNNNLPLHSILNNDDYPSRNSIPSSIPETPQSGKNILQPTLPPFTQAFDARASVDASTFDSRRSSIDSRMNVGMNHLQISPSAAQPYDKSQNVSRSSLASSLQQQRGISTDPRPLSGPGPLSPIGALRSSGAYRHQPRQAPAIAPDHRSIASYANPTAENPVKGFPWAFPDMDSGPEPKDRSSSGSEQLITRQNSYAGSMASSMFTNDSSLPVGQKRFSEDIQTHHHTLQHPAIHNLRPGDSNGMNPASGSYSRTPELRVSHKMAERKRRSEMKNLFDDLNNCLPTAAGGKSSKWEVLTRAIEHIKQTKVDLARGNQSRHDSENLRKENTALREEISTMLSSLHRLDPNHSHIYGPYTSNVAQTHDQNQSTINRPLPSLQNNQWSQGPNLMQGVEYGDHDYQGR